MVKSLIFHLGDPKTGTTSIQHALASKAWRCEGVTLSYTAAINHLPLAATLHDPKEFQHRDDRFKELARQLNKSDADIGIVSAELFEIVNPEALKSALETYLPKYAASARFIAYLRPHADRLVSAYAERVKQGILSGGIEVLHANMLRQQRLKYARRCQKWRDTFGDRYTLRPMMREHLVNGDVVHDFFSYVFDGRKFDLNLERTTNESLCLEDLSVLNEMLKPLRGKPELTKARKALGWNFAEILGESPRTKKTRISLHRSLAEQVVKTYRADAEAVDAAFFTGNPMLKALESAPSKAVDVPQSIDAADHFGPDELRMIRAFSKVIGLSVELAPDLLPKAFHSATLARLSDARKALKGTADRPKPAARSPKKKALTGSAAGSVIAKPV